MRFSTQRVLSVLCLILGLLIVPSQARDNVLNAIPDDAVAFAVVHNMSDTSRSIGEIAKLVQAPAPDLLSLAKGVTGLQKGVDEQGDLVIVLTSVDPEPKLMILVPVANFDDFFAALNVKEPASGAVEVQFRGKPSIVGRKGSHAVIAVAEYRDAVEKYLASTNNLAADKSLAAWLDANKASVVVTSNGLKQLLPKLVGGLLMIQGQLGQAGGESGEAVAKAFKLYVDLFNAAETEVDQFGIGVRIDSAQTIDIVKRVQFSPGGDWAQFFADAKPASEDFLGGFQKGPFAFAMGGIIPHQAAHELVKFSVQMMQSQPMYKFTPEQAQKYVDLSSDAMKGVRSMRMMMGVPEAGAGLYGNTSAVMTVDDSKRYMDSYEKSLAEMHKLNQDTKNPGIPAPTSQHIKIGETDVLEISMVLPNLKQVTPAGGQDMEKVMKLFAGPDGTMKIYVAPADEHTVLMIYTSREHMKTALDFYKSKQPGLSADAGLAKVAAALPPGSQVVAYASLSGIAKIAQQYMAAIPGGQASAIPDLPESPPLGMAAMVTPSGVEGHLVLMADTLRTIGDIVAKTRRPAAPPSKQQE